MENYKFHQFGAGKSTVEPEADMRDELLKLTKEKLVDALIELAGDSDRAADLIERMVSSPTENLSRFEQKLADLGRQNRYHDWRSVKSFARELRYMLEDLRAANPDPREGVRQVAALYEADEDIFNAGDDSSGDLGGIFRYDALELFCEFAAQCADKNWVIDLVVKLNQDDNYGVRDSLVDAAEKYLSKDEIRNMANRCLELAEQGGGEGKGRLSLHLVESLASQLKDAQLFEKVRGRGRGDTGPAACLDIARVHLESGDAKRALEWIERVPEDETFQASDRDKLLLEIHKNLGNQSEQKEIAWRSFRRYRSESTLATLLGIIGTDKREPVIETSVAEIMHDKSLNDSNARFLILVGRLNDAEVYLMARKDQLNGDHYSSLLEYAEAMESDQRLYAASIIYRELTDSILGRGISKYYHHGARYLKKLDQLAPKVSDWRGGPDHVKYFASVKQEHFRKKAFWSQYAGA